MTTFPKPQYTKKMCSLQPGDTVAVIAPASACTRSELKRGLNWLKSIGLNPKVSKNIFNKDRLFSHSDEERFNQLKSALYHEQVKAIWCVRGGYGSIRLLNDLKTLPQPKNPKLIIGYSDITTLHCFVQGQWGWPTLHGPLLDRFGRGDNLPGETKKLTDLLFGKKDEISFDSLVPLNKAALKTQTIKGSIIGGNLTVLVSSLGTCGYFLPQGHLVFLEDIGERPHRVDRMLTQLLLNNFFSKVKAVLFGPLLIQKLSDRRLIHEVVLPHFCETVNIPVFKGMPCGHGKKQWPLPMLTSAELMVSGEKGFLKVNSWCK